MEKLIELLNEYKKLGKYKEYWYNGKQVKLIEYAEDYAESTSEDITEKIISKKYGFIKWLVDNNKIDFTKDNIVEFGYYGTEWYCDNYDNILMNLSIQDNPIEFLVSILK